MIKCPKCGNKSLDWSDCHDTDYDLSKNVYLYVSHHCDNCDTYFETCETYTLSNIEYYDYEKE